MEKGSFLKGKMMYNFCTLFDTYYLTRGLAMYESLKRHCGNFHLYIFPFNAECYKILDTLCLENVTLISLEEFEDKELLQVKPDRSKGEYCWTSTSSTILYCLEKFNLDSCTYLDADIYFFNSPDILLEEVKDKSVLITSHRFTSKYDTASLNGKYCVQFMFFRNDENGLRALRWWRNSCLDWCYNRHENGKFGDQKYLDDWLERFDGVVELHHLGGGVAPWNVQQYIVKQDDGKKWLIEIKSKKQYPIIFYHFQNMKFFSRNVILTGPCKISKNAREIIYKPYLKTLFQIENALKGLYQVNYYEHKTKGLFKYLIKFLLKRVDIIIVWLD